MKSKTMLRHMQANRAKALQPRITPTNTAKRLIDRVTDSWDRVLSLAQNIALQEQALITCRAFFPDSKHTFNGVICYKGGQPAVFVEINCGWGGHVTYDVCVYQDHSKTIYSVSYDRMCARLKELNRIL